MATTVLTGVVFLLVPVGIGWKVAFGQLTKNPTPRVRLFFWIMSGSFIGLAVAAFVATRYIE